MTEEKSQAELFNEWLAEEGSELWNEHLAELIEEHRQDWYDAWVKQQEEKEDEEEHP